MSGVVAVLAAVILVWSLYMKKTKLALVAGIILIIAIPLWMDQILLNKWYLPYALKSSRDPEEWMDFLGSYLGVVGTIFVGSLAYWQTEVNRKQDQKIAQQDQEIQDLQKQITAYQVCPLIRFRDGKVKVHAGRQEEQKNQNFYRHLYYKLYGGELSEVPSFFVHINILFDEKGFIPVETFDVKEISWIVNDQEYIIRLSDEKSKTQNLPTEELQILIDQNDEVSKACSMEDGWQEFIDLLAIHQEYYFNGKASFDVSRLTIKFDFRNQIGKVRAYEVTYHICVEKNSTELRLQNPHTLLKMHEIVEEK